MSEVILDYYDESKKGEELFFSDAPKKKSLNDKSRFFRVIEEPNKIIKYSITGLDVDKTVEMITRFRLVKRDITRTQLPDSLYLEDGLVKGTVIPYFENSPSLYNIVETHSLEELSKVYQHDDDEIRNLFIMFEAILNALEELKDHSILYYDSNPGNFVIHNNQVEIIDFDHRCLRYEESKENIRKMLENFDELVFLVTKRLGLIDLPAFYPRNFKSMRKQLTKVENKIRKNMR